MKKKTISMIMAGLLFLLQPIQTNAVFIKALPESLTERVAAQAEAAKRLKEEINCPPEISIFPSLIYGREGTPIGFQFSVADSNGDPLLLLTPSVPPGSTLVENPKNKWNFSWVPNYSQAGTHTLTVRVTDGKDGMTAGTCEFVIVDVPQGVWITGYFPATSTVITQEGTGTTYSIDVSNPDQKPLTYSWILGTVTLVGATTGAVYIGWNYVDSGTHSLEARVTDGSSTAVQKWTVIVADVNRPPTIGISKIDNLHVGDPVTLSIWGDDPDGNKISFGVVSAPPNGTLTPTSNWTAQWKWTATTGTHSATFSATDDHSTSPLTATATTTLVVQ